MRLGFRSFHADDFTGRPPASASAWPPYPSRIDDRLRRPDAKKPQNSQDPPARLIFLRAEIHDFLLPVHDHPERWRLNPACRQLCIKFGRQRTRHIQSNHPIRFRPARADSYNRSNCCPGLSDAKPSLIALSVWEEIHSRLNGLFHFAIFRIQRAAPLHGHRWQ